jgi:multimeric flavodoxin WrbA
MFLDRACELAKEEWEGREIVSDTLILRELMMEPCNGCYSTASALCNFSCSCFPGDDIATKVYPHIMKADVMLFSTPVNQSMVSSRIKILLDRLISLDGGYFVEDLPMKDAKYREAAIALSQKNVKYDPRMFGKVAAYFVTSKDANNPLEESAPYPDEFKRLEYVDYVVGAISHQGAEYGWFHPDPFYSIMTAKHDEEMSFDKAEYDTQDMAHEQAKNVVLAALTMGEKFIDSPPKLKSTGRVNRT